MKQILAKFYAKCDKWLGREKTQPDDPGMARYNELYKTQLAWVKKNPEQVAHIFAGQMEDRIIRDEEFKQDDRQERSTASDKHSVGYESERNQRTDRLIELGKSYRPSDAERCPENDPSRIHNRNDFDLDRE